MRYITALSYEYLHPISTTKSCVEQRRTSRVFLYGHFYDERLRVFRNGKKTVHRLIYTTYYGPRYLSLGR